MAKQDTGLELLKKNRKKYKKNSKFIKVILIQL